MSLCQSAVGAQVGNGARPTIQFLSQSVMRDWISEIPNLPIFKSTLHRLYTREHKQLYFSATKMSHSGHTGVIILTLENVYGILYPRCLFNWNNVHGKKKRLSQKREIVTSE